MASTTVYPPKYLRVVNRWCGQSPTPVDARVSEKQSERQTKWNECALRADRVYAADQRAKAEASDLQRANQLRERALEKQREQREAAQNERAFALRLAAEQQEAEASRARERLRDECAATREQREKARCRSWPCAIAIGAGQKDQLCRPFDQAQAAAKRASECGARDAERRQRVAVLEPKVAAVLDSRAKEAAARPENEKWVREHCRWDPKARMAWEAERRGDTYVLEERMVGFSSVMPICPKGTSPARLRVAAEIGNSLVRQGAGQLVSKAVYDAEDENNGVNELKDLRAELEWCATNGGASASGSSGSSANK